MLAGRILSLAGAALLLLGCQSTQTFAPSDTAVRTEINAVDDDREADVTFADGTVRTVTALHVGPDVTTWIDPETREMGRRPTDEVRRIQVKHHGRGALQGLALGVATGAVTGALLGAATYEEPSEGSFCFVFCSRSEAVGLGAVALGIVGLPIGTVAGAVRGHRERFVIEVPTPASSPPDSTRSSALRPQ